MFLSFAYGVRKRKQDKIEADQNRKTAEAEKNRREQEEKERLEAHIWEVTCMDLPPAVATKDIYVTLGSPWVPTDIIDDFIEHLFKKKYEYWYNGENVYAVKHDAVTGTWEIRARRRGY